MVLWVAVLRQAEKSPKPIRLPHIQMFLWSVQVLTPREGTPQDSERKGSLVRAIADSSLIRLGRQ